MTESTNPQNNDLIPEPVPLTAEEKAAILAKAKAAFTAADLQRFTEIEESIPFEEVVKMMRKKVQEAVQKKA